MEDISSFLCMRNILLLHFQEVNKTLKSQNQRWSIEVAPTPCYFSKSDFNFCSKTPSIIYKSAKLSQKKKKKASHNIYTKPSGKLPCLLQLWIRWLRPGLPTHGGRSQLHPADDGTTLTPFPSRRPGSCRACGHGGLGLVLHHPVLTMHRALRADPTPPRRARKAPSGWAWQDLGWEFKWFLLRWALSTAE